MRAKVQYNASLMQIKDATDSGKIKWVRNRPESFKYKTMNEDLEDLVIQITKLHDGFILTLEKKDFEGSEVLLNIDTATNDHQFTGILEELYTSIEYNVDMNNLESLNEFIELVNNENNRKSILD